MQTARNKIKNTNHNRKVQNKRKSIVGLGSERNYISDNLANKLKLKK